MARFLADILYLALMLIFFLACAGFARLCERLK